MTSPFFPLRTFNHLQAAEKVTNFAVNCGILSLFTHLVDFTRNIILLSTVHPPCHLCYDCSRSEKEQSPRLEARDSPRANPATPSMVPAGELLGWEASQPTV